MKLFKKLRYYDDILTSQKFWKTKAIQLIHENAYLKNKISRLEAAKFKNPSCSD